LHIICFSEINNAININSLASIENDKYFKCIEYSKLDEYIKLGIIIYETDKENKLDKDYISYYISRNLINNSYINNDIFDSSGINEEYKYIYNQIGNNNCKLKSKRLKKLYISPPMNKLKRYSIKFQNRWNFINIYNEYFCICKGFKCLNFISKKCKYLFYLYLIDKNSNIYRKTHFLLMDFILNKYSSDDVYPVFEEMINKNVSAHYLTEKVELYEKYCKNEIHCDKIILCNEKNYKINDEFLEKHFTLILKLKSVLSAHGVDINFINNTFYNIDYINYVCIGHGVSFFKYYLYNEYYGPNNFDKLLVPDSKKLISMAVINGWNENNIIKLNLPRWDKYFNNNKYFNDLGSIVSNSIFIMFTWRELKKNQRISRYYMDNIISLINNDKLNNHLIKYNVTLYFSLHRQLIKYSNKFKKIKKIKYIEEKYIAECLSKTNLVISDFSSIIFDMIFRGKPYIIYIPDANDTNIINLYKTCSYDVIKNFTKNDFMFENIFFDLDSAVNKIIYYIENRFLLDRKLINFYKEFNFKNESLNKFLNYILKIK